MNMDVDRENQSASGKTCHNATLCTTNSTLAALGFKPVVCSDNSVTNHMTYGMA
jgi:hypothetical protein